MSEKCKHCGDRIFDEQGQSFGIQLHDGTWCCYDDGCMGQQIGDSDEAYAALLAAAREVVKRRPHNISSLDVAITQLAALLKQSAR